MAHIRGERPSSNRHDPDQTDKERNDYSNLILLCPNHHTLIDRPENEEVYGTAKLREIKDAHEAYVMGRLQTSGPTHKREVAEKIYPLMKENYEAFINYGPLSKIARKHPQSEAHAVWLSERLSTIIPNNRCMLTTVIAHKDLFSPKEQATLARFAIHVRSYEPWVREEISYEAVVPFPPEFETLISGLIDASSQ